MQPSPALHSISKRFLHLVPRRYCTPHPGISVHNVSGKPFNLFSHATHGVAWQRRLTIHHIFLNSVGLHVDTTIIVRACRHCHEGIAPILPPTPGWTFQTDIFDRSSPLSWEQGRTCLRQMTRHTFRCNTTLSRQFLDKGLTAPVTL